MKETVLIRLRVCTVCKHTECVCCRDWCDQRSDVTDEDGDWSFCDCDGHGNCVYSEPVDEEGYARLDAAAERLRKDGHGCGYTTTEDGTGVIVSGHGDHD